MPPLPPIANTIKLAFLFDNSPVGAGVTNSGANILHAQYASPLSFTAVELTAIANAAMTWFMSHFGPSICTNWRLRQCLVTAVDGSGVQGPSTAAAVLGTNAGSNLPPQTSVAVSWLGAPAYRGGKPRTYLCGIPNSAINAGTSQVTPAYASTLRTAAIAALGDMTWATIGGTTAQLGAVSYISKTLNPTPPHHRTTPLFWPYLSARVHERLDSQRRRSGKESAFIVT